MLSAYYRARISSPHWNDSTAISGRKNPLSRHVITNGITHKSVEKICSALVGPLHHTRFKFNLNFEYVSTQGLAGLYQAPRASI